MALFTRKGDGGTTGLFGCNQKMSKSSAIAEALGSLDECNSFLGLCKARAKQESFTRGERAVADIVHDVQNHLFTLQAEVAGADKHIPTESVIAVEEMINAIEKELPPIKSFLISGATELSAWFDVARTLARRAERRVVAVHEEGKRPINEHTRSYLNRLSSLLYALARLANQRAGISETSPEYK
ncbi:MAG: cob(I)yrinic acid a,c-diamide adenosyltransferase [Parcubacteria group bacterium]|nr:cob(I)yrinic acid a,c-diamide adenosyltransferase [Parcubacteria group bacterium]